MTEIEIQKIEDKKYELKRYKRQLAKIDRLEEKLALLDSRISTVRSPNYSGMPRGGTPVTTADMIADREDLLDRILKAKNRAREMKREITEEIDTLEDPKHVEILEAFLVDNIRLEDIDTYTTRHVYRLYSEAVTALALREPEIIIMKSL